MDKIFIDAANSGGDLTIWVRDESGKLHTEVHDASDFTYLFDLANGEPNTNFTDIYGRPLRKIMFDKRRDMREYADTHDSVIEHSLSPKYKAFRDLFHDAPENIDFNVWYYDIEVDFDLSMGLGYPRPDNPYGPINSYQVYDPQEEAFIIFYVYDYDIELPEELSDKPIYMIRHKDERELLMNVAKQLDEMDIDITTAWFGCVTPDHKILTADLEYKPAGELKVGDKLIAFDEYPDGKKKRKWQESEVTFAKKIPKQVSEIYLSNGEVLRATNDHPWFIPSYTGCESGSELRNNGYKYVNTDELKPGMPFERMIDFWEEDLSKEAGYLAGFFDGEGTVSQYKRTKSFASSDTQHSLPISGSQKRNACFYEAQRCLKVLGYDYATYDYDPNNRDISSVTLRGGVHDNLKFLGSVRPKRLLETFNAAKLPSIRKHKSHERVYVEKVVPIGEQEVMGLSTSTKTYIVEGYGSHNSGFDLPYIMARSIKLFGHNKAKRMYCRGGFEARSRETVDDYGNEKIVWSLVGRHDVDLMEVYKSFVPSERKSFSLSAVSIDEIDEDKVEYAGDLGKLYRENPVEFFTYAYQDVNLLRRLDEKRQMLMMGKVIALTSGVTMGDILGSVKPIEGGLRHYCYDKNIILPEAKQNDDEDYEGAIVYDTVTGKHGWVFTNDLTSLYPTVIYTLGMSPETMMFQCQGEFDDYVHIMTDDDSHGMIKLEVIEYGEVSEVTNALPSEIHAMIKEEGMTISANGTIFSGDLGVLAGFIADSFALRIEYKRLKKEYGQAGDTVNESMYDLKQQVVKVNRLNSTYGITANQHSSIYDMRLAKSITTSAQIISKQQAYQSNQAIDFIEHTLTEAA